MIAFFPGRGGRETDDKRKADSDGSTTEFSDRLLAHLPRLRRYAIALTRNITLADDLVQDCIERACRKQDLLQDPERLMGWLRTTLINLYRDNLRRERRRGVPIELDAVLDLAGNDPIPSDWLAMKELAGALDLLSPDHREILLLAALEDLSYREIADTLRLPIGTVMSRLSRARAQLRDALERGDVTPSSIRSVGGSP
ncbi:RNA polymerase sigma factor [Roseiterribacter gracilis]|uniref:RNA polymerase sigma factor n=1 Tax=Roseiterribacter gracilis TaxID=2812848 RepID=A0A8S8XF53_9PROT|nr:RNA polymerase sigma factor [Rhodospirillales bacterium TMPK1]